MQAPDWLEQNYPDKGWRTKSIYLNQPLVGVLDCQEYKSLKYIFISTSVDSSQLEIKRGSYWEGKEKTQIIPCLLAQTYLNQKYPTQQARVEVKELYINEKGLEGNLDLADFPNLEWLDCFNNCLTNLNVNNCQQLNRIRCHTNQLTTLNLGNLEQLKELNCPDNYLTQIIYPTNPKKLTELYISNNNLNPSDLTIFSPMRNLEQLEISNTDKNKINQGIYNKVEGSLEHLKDLNKLYKLYIENTDLSSGWEYLPDSLEGIYYKSKLRPNCQLAQVAEQWDQELWKDIHKDFAPKHKKDWLAAGYSKEQTKEWIIAGAKHDSTEFINWFLNFKILPSAGSKEDVNKLGLEWAQENEEEFQDLRDGYKYFGTCQECQQPNTSRDWCQSCNAKHFQAEFPNWTSGNTQIDKFIQQCQLAATSDWNVLEWIPYEKFNNIEHLADGGFGKVEKVEWEEGSIKGWDNKEKKWKRYGDYVGYDNDSQQDKYQDYRTVALKTLSNSQNLNQEFLAELTLYKMFRSSVSQMVPCYGISRDTEGNYIMVMKFMEKGNLREFLRKNYRELDLKDKLDFLKQISQGLKDIHRKQLVHRDFHSGNIIVESKYSDGSGEMCHITDLGLSKPVNEVATANNIYGLMPYVAPEVLKGKPYTPASDIYSLGMIMYEIFTGYPPFAKEVHDVNLALQICQGLRPQFPKQVKYPQLLIDLIKKCWEQEPNNRPTAREISSIVGEWFGKDTFMWLTTLKKDTELYHQYQKAEEYNKTLPKEIRYPNYQSQEVWYSKPINTQQIIKLSEQQHSANLELDLDNFNLGELTIPENPQEESSTQAQQEIPPKK